MIPPNTLEQRMHSKQVWRITKIVYSLVKECLGFTKCSLSSQVRTMAFKLRCCKYQQQIRLTYKCQSSSTSTIWGWSVQTSVSGWDRHCLWQFRGTVWALCESRRGVRTAGETQTGELGNRFGSQIVPRLFNHSISTSLCRLLEWKWFAPIGLINHTNTKHWHKRQKIKYCKW